MFTTFPLSQIDGYIILISFGIIFSLIMIIITLLLQRFNGENQMSSEIFITGNRKIRSGLISSSIVSSWTWTATLLQSTSVTYLYGISGAFWYANGATIQIILFSIIAIEFKRRAPFAHTYLEIIRVRYGREGHWIFILFFLFTNILVTLMLLTGCSAVIHSLCGMNIIAACLLIPLGTIVYTTVGGIKATFLTNYVHTVIIIIIILFFSLTTYQTSSLLGSFSKIYNLLINASLIHPIDGNFQGSYLTIKSRDGLIFFFINLIGNFGTVFLDNGYYNKVIAASSTSAVHGYILGGIAWFAIPFVTGTTMGIVAITIEDNVLFPTYPNRLSENDINSGLTLPSAAIVLLGKSGSILSFIMIYLACTSAMSSQLISVGSIITFDIYRTYFNTNASGKKLFFISILSLLVFTLTMSILSIGLYYISINLGYLYTMMGIIISSAVLPSILTLFSNKQSKLAACLSPPLGLICSIISWLLTSKYLYGKITIQSTGSNLSMLVGNLVALLTPFIFIPLFSFIKPDEIPYDFKSMREIKLIDDDLPNPNRINTEDVEHGIIYIKENSRFVRLLAIGITICLIIIWPWPLYGTSYIFNERFFTFWICFGIIWLIISFIIVGIYPIIQHHQTIKSVLRLIYFDIKTFIERD
ncbi:hypothetical protein I4U23_022063 [Adineta vaga]|nr:hypothetical protein I4U23_022063 [Adineta vaga]